jgi:1,4-alpha-glucan branching enzyme
MARKWREIFNSDRAEFGGSDLKNDSEIVVSENSTMIEVVLPPLATIWIAPSVKS